VQKVDDKTALDYLEDLAAALNVVPSSELSVRGLWAELFVMKLFPSIDLGVLSWQRKYSERFDFAVGEHRLEVKSYAGPVRKLEFRHQQMHVEDGLDLSVISLRVLESAAGQSVTALAYDVMNQISNPAASIRIMTALEQVCDLEAQDSELLFDLAVATESVAFSPGNLLPRLNSALPDGILDAHLTVELRDQHLSAQGADAVTKAIAEYCDEE
jgi:hypothetical protein